MSRYSVRKLTGVLLALAIAASVLAAGGSLGGQGALVAHETDQDTSYVRVAHASPDAPAVDVYVDDQPVLTEVEFGDVSDYLAVAPGDHNVTITAAGDADAVVFNGTVTLDARSASTITATGELAENATQPFAPAIYSDDALAPGENQSALRVVHLSPDAPAVDVTVTENNTTSVLADDVSFGNASEYVSVPAGNYTVEIRAATEANNGTVVTTVDVTLEGGTAYSAMAVGYLDTASAPADTPFALALTEDAKTSIALPSDETNATATPNGTATGTETGTDVGT